MLSQFPGRRYAQKAQFYYIETLNGSILTTAVITKRQSCKKFHCNYFIVIGPWFTSANQQSSWFENVYVKVLRKLFSKFLLPLVTTFPIASWLRKKHLSSSVRENVAMSRKGGWR